MVKIVTLLIQGDDLIHVNGAGTTAIAVIVNLKNPVENLSTEHLQKIYDKSIVSWKELK